MLLLLVLSAVFWRERAWFIDIAFQTVYLIKEGTLQVQLYRFGSGVVQLLPLLAIKLALPLGWVSWLYSVSIHLLFLLFFLISTYALRRSEIGLGIALLYTLMVYDGFYWATSELQQGLGLTLVQYAFWLRYPRLDRWWQGLLQVALTVVLCFYHPLVFIAYFFGWAYLGWSVRELRHYRYLLAGVWMGVVLFIQGRYFGNYYDAYRQEVFWNNLTAYWPNYFQFAAWGDFFRHLLGPWWGLAVAWGVVLLGLSGQRKWVRLAMVAGATFAFLLVSVIFSPQTPYRFYAEVNYYPLAVFVILPLCVDLLPQWFRSAPKLTGVGLALFLAARLAGIALAHQPFTQRLDWLSDRIEAGRRAYPEANRFYLPNAPARGDTLLMTWGTAFETLLMTATEAGPAGGATLYLLNDADEWQREALERPDQLVGPFRKIKAAEVDGYYFRLGEGGYRPLVEE